MHFPKETTFVEELVTYVVSKKHMFIKHRSLFIKHNEQLNNIGNTKSSKPLQDKTNAAM